MAGTGNRPPMAPAAVVGTYLTRQNDWVAVTSGTTAAVLKVVRMLRLPEVQYATAQQQAQAAGLLDRTQREWPLDRDTEDALRKLLAADVVASRIYTGSSCIGMR